MPNLLKPNTTGKPVIVEKKLTAETFFSDEFLTEDHFVNDGELQVSLLKDRSGTVTPFLSVQHGSGITLASPDQFRITVAKDQLPRALKLILPILTHSDALFKSFNVTYNPIIKRLVATGAMSDRSVMDGAITLFVKPDTSEAVTIATRLAKITNVLTRNKIKPGAIPLSDLRISAYISACCAYEPVASRVMDEYIGVTGAKIGPSVKTKHCHLFLLAKLYETVRVKLMAVSPKDARWKKIVANISKFDAEYSSNGKLTHKELIDLFIVKVFKPVEELVNQTKVVDVARRRRSSTTYLALLRLRQMRRKSSAGAASGAGSSKVPEDKLLPTAAAASGITEVDKPQTSGDEVEVHSDSPFGCVPTCCGC